MNGSNTVKRGMVINTKNVFVVCFVLFKFWLGVDCAQNTSVVYK